MATAFGGTTAAPRVLKAGKAIVTVNNKEILALNVQLSFSREVQVVPVLSKRRVISIGEPQGQFTAQTILAKGEDAFSAFKLSGDDCKPFDMKIKLDANGACDLDGKTFTAKNCFSQGITVEAVGGRGYVGQGLQVMFTALDVG